MEIFRSSFKRETEIETVCEQDGYTFDGGWVQLDLKLYADTTLKQHPTCLSHVSVS